MKVLITGASGLIGTQLQKSFVEKEYEMRLATRGELRHPNQIRWNTETGFAKKDLERVENFDAIIHLAGENVSGLRWTDDKKKSIRDSRVNGTHNVVENIAKLKNKPRVFISGSAIGFMATGTMM